ncbi:MAG: ATP-binding protein [Saprospiraceae bacterium]
MNKEVIQYNFFKYLDANPNNIILLDFAYQIEFANKAVIDFLKSNGIAKSSLKTIFDLVAIHYRSVLQSSLDDISAMIEKQKEVICTLSVSSQKDIFATLSFHRYNFENISGIEVVIQPHYFAAAVTPPFEVLSKNKSFDDIFRKLVHQEQELEQSQQRYRIISENSHDVVTLYDTDFNFRFVSPSIINYGQVPAEFVGRNFFEVFNHRPNFCDLFQTKIFEPLLQNKTKLIGPIIITRITDESEKDLELIAKPIFDDDDNLTFILTTEQDVSERLKAELELKEALKREKHLNELKTQFVSMASHQFRTPLSVIKANMELFEMLKTQLSGKAIRQAERIITRTKNEINRLTVMIDDVLILGKLDATKTPYRPQQVDLTKLCKSIIDDEFDNESDNRKCQLIIKGESQLVWCDKNLMFHAITNLVSNAFKYSKGTPNPILELTYHETTVDIAIIDFGIGINKKDKQNLFQSFFRSQHVLDIKGTGLGLVIAKEFVELNNGTISIESELQKGSKFVIHLQINNNSNSESTKE